MLTFPSAANLPRRNESNFVVASGANLTSSGMVNNGVASCVAAEPLSASVLTWVVAWVVWVVVVASAVVVAAAAVVLTSAVVAAVVGVLEVPVALVAVVSSAIQSSFLNGMDATAI